MKFSVTFRHTEPTDAIKEYAEQKLGKVKKYLNEPIDLAVVLSVEKIRHTAEASLTADRQTITCHEETQDMYSAIDGLADKLEAQVKKAKGRMHSRRGAGAETGVEAD